MSNLVVQNKIAFGSPEYMFMRRDMNKMMLERDKLRWGVDRYLINKERVDFLQNTIRAMADNVYFTPRERKKMHASDYVLRPLVRPEKKKKEKKVKKPRNLRNENQQQMFNENDFCHQ